MINNNLKEQANIFFEKWYTESADLEQELSKIIEVRDGTHDSPKPKETGYPLVTSKHLMPFCIDLESPNKISKEDYDKANARSKVDKYDILMSMIGTIGLVSFVHQDIINFAIKNVALFKTSKYKDFSYYLLLFLQSSLAKQYLDVSAAGSTQQYISLAMLRKIPIKIPSKESLDYFNQVIEPIINKMCQNSNENKYLASIRDLLLPKLMSGELDVSEILI